DERSLHRVTPPYDPRDWTGSVIGLVRFHESPPVVGEYKRDAGDVMSPVVVQSGDDFQLLEVLIDEGLSRRDQPRFGARHEARAERIHRRAGGLGQQPGVPGLNGHPSLPETTLNRGRWNSGARAEEPRRAILYPQDTRPAPQLQPSRP